MCNLSHDAGRVSSSYVFREVPRYLLNTGMDGHRSQGGGLGEAKNLSPLPGIEPRFLIPPALSPVIMLKNCTEQSPSSEAVSSSASQKIQAFYEPEGSLPNPQQPAPVTALSRINPLHVPIQLIQVPNLTSSFHLRLGFASGLFPSGLPTKTPRMYLTSLPYMQHAPPIPSI